MKRLTIPQYLLLLLSITVYAYPAAAQITFSQTQEISKTSSSPVKIPEFKGGPEALNKILQEHLVLLKTTDEGENNARLVLSFSVAADGSVTVLNVVSSGFTLKKPKNPGGSYAAEKEPSKYNRLLTASTAAINATNGKWILNSKDKAPVLLAMHATFNGNDSPTGEIKPFTDPKANQVYKRVDQMPHYKGGQDIMMQDFTKSLHIPEEAKRENLSARIITSFIVEKDGSISNLRLLDTQFKKMIGPGAELDYMDASTFNIQNKTVLARLSEAAMNALKETSNKWEAGQKSGKNVRVEMLLPITFTSSDPPRATLETLSSASQDGGKSNSTLDKPYTFVEEMPEYKDGDTALINFLMANINYPEAARKNNIEGIVVLTYVVEKNGKLSSIEVAKGISPEINKEAIRVLNLTKDEWLPGKQGGVPVRVKFTLPVRFSLNSTKE